MPKNIPVILLLMTIITGCSSLPDDIKHSHTPAVSQSNSALFELTNNPRFDQKKDETSGVLLQNSGWDALAQRLALIETAQHSIDIQYYIWNSDISGQYLASRLLAAANRGVKVRVMLDDINLNEREDLLTTIDAHPNIEIRIYNPIPTRKGVTKWLNVLSDFSRLNRRMHNKSFTVDGVISVVGGRNIGDEYFDLSNDINFRDRDVLVIGSVITDIQTSFLKYWDSRWSYPVNLLGGTTTDNLNALNKVEPPHYTHYPELPEGHEKAYQLLSNLMASMTWVKAHYVSDQPVPIDENDSSHPKATAKYLANLASQSENELVLESAYLIFDDRQLKAWQKLTQNSVKIKALTNSMASNDLITNHSGYAGRREDMLAHGIQLFELKPDADLCELSTKDETKCPPKTAYGLHAKSIVFDNKVAVIGSFNFNLRSTYLNTESILVIEDTDLAKSLAADINQAMNDNNSWRLELHDDDIRWYSGNTSWESEPETKFSERLKSRLLQLFPIEKYL